MQCDCIQLIENKIKEDYAGKYKTAIKRVTFINQALIFSSPMDVISTSNIEIELEGKKKKNTISMMHTYCPFCGKETKEKVEAEVSNG